jgi:phosphoglycolate phosphatase
MKKLLIFDFDGVLEDTFDWNFEVAKKRYKGINKEEYRTWFNGNIYEHPCVLEAGPMNIKEYFKIYKKGFANKKLKSNYIKLLKDLKKEFILVIISSIDEDIILPYLKRSNALNLFDDVWGYKTELSKANKFKKFLEKYKISGENCLFITDTLGDILEAKKVGILTVGVTWGYHSKKALLEGNPIFIANTIEELKEYLLSRKFFV